LPRDDEPPRLDPTTDAADQVPVQPQTIVRVPVRDLLDGRVELLIDDAGNRMVAAAMARPIDLCERGFLAGRWHKVEEGRAIAASSVASTAKASPVPRPAVTS